MKFKPRQVIKKLIMSNIKQIWAHLKQDPMVSAVSIIGTALSIFLIMVVVAIRQVKTVPIAPEMNRNRMLFSSSMIMNGILADNKNSWSVSSMSAYAVKELYQSLKTPELVSKYAWDNVYITTSVPGMAPVRCQSKATDQNFWKVFNFSFLQGKSYDSAMIASQQKVVVIEEWLARKYYGGTDAVGKEIDLNSVPYKIIGVVKNTSQLTNKAFANIWSPYTADMETLDTQNGIQSMLQGPFSVGILARNSRDLPVIHKEADVRLAAFNKKIAPQGFKVTQFGRPFTQAQEAYAMSTNQPIDFRSIQRKQLIIIVILLLVPAINLSSMTHSRLRRKMAEIGIRRAFGSTRGEMLLQIINENLIITILAGIIGWLLSVVFVYFGIGMLVSSSFNMFAGTVKVFDIVHFSTFLLALIFCFVLNLISTLIPAWRASRVNIVNAVGGNNR
jgi:putative ABC transport system permease protein